MALYGNGHPLGAMYYFRNEDSFSMFNWNLLFITKVRAWKLVNDVLYSPFIDGGDMSLNAFRITSNAFHEFHFK